MSIGGDYRKDSDIDVAVVIPRSGILGSISEYGEIVY